MTLLELEVLEFQNRVKPAQQFAVYTDSLS
jgi:hypothetical protein